MQAAIEYHRSRPATADLDDRFPRADFDVSWATAGCYLYAVIHSCHALTPMMRSMSEGLLGVYLYSRLQSHTVSTLLLQYHHRGPNYSFFLCASDRLSHRSARSLTPKHTRLTNGKTCFIRCASMLHRSDSNSHPSSFLHSTISVWQTKPYIS